MKNGEKTVKGSERRWKGCERQRTAVKEGERTVKGSNQTIKARAVNRLTLSLSVWNAAINDSESDNDIVDDDSGGDDGGDDVNDNINDNNNSKQASSGKEGERSRATVRPTGHAGTCTAAFSRACTAVPPAMSPMPRIGATLAPAVSLVRSVSAAPSSSDEEDSAACANRPRRLAGSAAPTARGRAGWCLRSPTLAQHNEARMLAVEAEALGRRTGLVRTCWPPPPVG